MAITMEPEEELELEPLESETEDENSAFEPTPFKPFVYPADFTLQGLLDKWEAKSLVLPPFQRQYVWTKSRASQLIESFLLGLPVPGIFLYKERQTQHLLVIDGQQRLLSVFYFLRGKFKDEEGPFKLTGLRTQWNGVCFNEMPEPDQLELTDSVLRATIVNQIYTEDKSSIHDIFRRLNTTTTPLSNQEIRNCVSWGKLNDLLNEMNQSDHNWRLILGKQQPDPRKRDVELILRVLALLERRTEYKKPMKEFLNYYMDLRRDPDDNDLFRLRGTFMNATELIVRELGEKPFHVRAGLNAAVCDSVLVATAKHLRDYPSNLKERYVDLTKNEDYRAVTNFGTTDENTVSKRLDVAEHELFVL